MTSSIWIVIILIILSITLLALYFIKKYKKHYKLKILKITLAAQEREKERIAKDLHDYFGARLSTLKLYMQTINKFDVERISSMTNVAMQMVDNTIVELRHLLFDLNPKKLYKGGLQEALQELINNIKSILKYEIDINCDFNKNELAYSSEISIYRILQELINNTLKHAKANKISIQLLQDKKDLVVVYKDDGIGFDQEKINHGYGLRYIRQHSQALEANMKLSTAALKGLECTITIPVK